MLRTGKINLTHIANDQLVKIALNFSKCKKKQRSFSFKWRQSGGILEHQTQSTQTANKSVFTHKNGMLFT